jgi:hypothetical protein
MEFKIGKPVTKSDSPTNCYSINTKFGQHHFGKEELEEEELRKELELIFKVLNYKKKNQRCFWEILKEMEVEYDNDILVRESFDELCKFNTTFDTTEWDDNWNLTWFDENGIEYFAELLK